MNFFRPTTAAAAVTGAALTAAIALTPAGAQAAKLITGADIKDGTVTGADIANGSLTSEDLAPGATPPGNGSGGQAQVYSWSTRYTTAAEGGSGESPAPFSSAIPAFTEWTPIDIDVDVVGDSCDQLGLSLGIEQSGDDMLYVLQDVEAANDPTRSNLEMHAASTGSEPRRLTVAGAYCTQYGEEWTNKSVDVDVKVTFALQALPDPSNATPWQ